MPLYVNRQKGRIGLVSIVAWGMVWYGVSQGRHLVLYEAFRNEARQRNAEDRGRDPRLVRDAAVEASSSADGWNRYRSLPATSGAETIPSVESERGSETGWISTISYWLREGDDWVEITADQAIQLSEKGSTLYQVDQWSGELIPYRGVGPSRR